MAVDVTTKTVTFDLLLENQSETSRPQVKRSLTFDFDGEPVDFEENIAAVGAMFTSATYNKLVQPSGWLDDSDTGVYTTTDVGYYTTTTTKHYIKGIDEVANE